MLPAALLVSACATTALAASGLPEVTEYEYRYGAITRVVSDLGAANGIPRLTKTRFELETPQDTFVSYGTFGGGGAYATFTSSDSYYPSAGATAHAMQTGGYPYTDAYYFDGAFAYAESQTSYYFRLLDPTNVLTDGMFTQANYDIFGYLNATSYNDFRSGAETQMTLTRIDAFGNEVLMGGDYHSVRYDGADHMLFACYYLPQGCITYEAGRTGSWQRFSDGEYLEDPFGGGLFIDRAAFEISENYTYRIDLFTRAYASEMLSASTNGWITDRTGLSEGSGSGWASAYLDPKITIDIGTLSLEFSTGIQNRVGAGMDDIPKEFRTSPFATAVPEPSTWALMVMSFGTIGIVLRRRLKLA